MQEDEEMLVCADLDDVAHSSSSSIIGEPQLDGVRLTVRSRQWVRDKKWELNCHEAAIYLQEGENNDKFTSHPRNQETLPAYLITHNCWFYTLNLFAACLLLGLAVIEPPSLFHVHIGIHASIELLCLLVIIVELGMRMKWLGIRQFFKHHRTLVKSVSMVIMIVESITVLIRQTSHFRVTRAIRPLLLLDCYHMKGVRRFIRQVMQSLPAILDMLVLLLFFMLLFSMLGFFLFREVPNDTNFESIQRSFVSLFVLMTTANFPDVMQPAYASNKWSAIFFIVYLSLELYLFMNLFLAVVYDRFQTFEKEKMRNLLLHKREGCEKAFRLLVTRQSPHSVSVRQFEGLIKYYKARMSRRDVYLTFKALNASKSGALNLEEFYSVYTYVSLNWKRRRHEKHVWSSRFHYPLNRFFKGLHDLVAWKWFDYTVYFVIVINLFWILADTIDISVASNNRDKGWERKMEKYIWCSTIFVALYILEALLKILGLGPKKYFTSGWNVFDFFVTATSAIGVLLEFVNQSLYFVLILRPLRLLRLFKLKRLYRDVLGTVFILSSILVSISIVIIIVYYVFAIIGMEVFSSHDMRNCCKGSSVEQYYYYEEVNGTEKGGYYYLSNFDNILVAGVTLFELTVVNNWQIIMEGYAIKCTEWSRIYFMCFYVVTMIIMTVVVTFILEAFIFRMQYRKTVANHDLDDDAIMKVDTALSPEELAMCLNKNSPLTSNYITSQTGTESNLFRGERLRSKDDFSVIMNRQQVAKWIEDHKKSRCEELQLIERPSEGTSLIDNSGPEDS